MEISVRRLCENLIHGRRNTTKKKGNIISMYLSRVGHSRYSPLVYATGDTRRGIEIDATGRNGKRGCSRVDLRSRTSRLAVSGVTQRPIGRPTSHASSPPSPSPSPVTNASRPQVRSRGAGASTVWLCTVTRPTGIAYFFLRA